MRHPGWRSAGEALEGYALLILEIEASAVGHPDDLGVRGERAAVQGTRPDRDALSCVL